MAQAVPKSPDGHIFPTYEKENPRTCLGLMENQRSHSVHESDNSNMLDIYAPRHPLRSQLSLPPILLSPLYLRLRFSQFLPLLSQLTHAAPASTTFPEIKMIRKESEQIHQAPSIMESFCWTDHLIDWWVLYIQLCGELLWAQKRFGSISMGHNNQVT